MPKHVNRTYQKVLFKLGWLATGGVLLQAGGCSVDGQTVTAGWFSSVTSALLTSYFNDMLGAPTGLYF
jgi:hypothetical protein